jgi:hypothetical protein
VVDLSTMRHALRDRLTGLDSTVVVFETARETVRAPRVIIIYPRPWHWMSTCNVEYPFLVEVWVSTDMGLDRAQDVLDAYLSPKGTNALSIESKAEDRTIADDLTTDSGSVVVGAFESYSEGVLNDTDGWLVATVPVSCYSTS